MKPEAFSPAAYGPVVQTLLEPARLPELGPGSPNMPAKPALEAVRLPATCRAGLWLYHDFLDESHAISQEDESDPDRNFWHAIMHRREPDASNSKYWWRRVGNHPVIAQLREQALTLGHPYTTPEGFVDFCERVRGSGSADEMLARRVQLLEWRLLFDHCSRKAASPA